MIIGRKQEQQELLDAANADYSKFVAVYGRRRVGKTFLIRETFKYSFTFQHTGLAHGKLKEQLLGFRASLQKTSGKKFGQFKSWYDAFFALEEWLSSLPKGKKIVFFDELPWMDTPRSNFISGLEHFWNSWASARKDILLIVCGSATSWIVKKIINNHGGLHNRLTNKILLQPFTLSECEQYSEANHLGMSRYQIVENYMIMGGIPFYWSLMKKNLSQPQNIDALFFADNIEGLSHEYEQLYASLFNNPEPYMQVVTALATKNKGLSREEIVKISRIESSGNLTRYLNELEWCGFIRKYNCISKQSKDALYQLIDNFTLFYFHYIKGNKNNDTHFWTNNIDSQLHRTWSGIAFERVCLQHIKQIKAALGISSVLSNVYSWQTEANEDKGIDKAQIDLLIDRNDGIINLCEMKFSAQEYAISADEEMKLRRRRGSFVIATKTKKAVHITIVAPYGLKRNSHSSIAQNEVNIENLFGTFKFE
ncbi:MAG: ATP-binding protein [Muribaculaceae bacterium]|nr:ATP-binding protein [Muribaculaceae bacterium]